MAITTVTTEDFARRLFDRLIDHYRGRVLLRSIDTLSNSQSYTPYSQSLFVSFYIDGNLDEELHANIPIGDHEIINHVFFDRVFQQVVEIIDRSIIERWEARVRDQMAQWNQRPNQSLQQRERQRREAANPNLEQERIEQEQIARNQAEFNRQRSQITPEFLTYINNATIAVSPWTTSYPRTTDSGMSTMHTSRYYTSPFDQYQPVNDRVQPVQTPEANLSTMKKLLKEMLEEGLSLSIEMTESDGEITVEVEVMFEGVVVASDSDHIQL